MKNLIKLSIIISFLFFQASFAQGSGQLTKHNVNYRGNTVSQVTAKWYISSLMGEPVVNGTFKWNANRDYFDYNTFIILKAQSNTSRGSYAWIKISPVVPKNGAGYGMNAAGSPNWNSIFCGYDANGRSINCWSADDAKAFWKAGFTIVDFLVIHYNN